MNITQDEILLYIKNTISINITGNDYLNEPLTGDKFRLTASELLYLYFKIEKDFNIKINKKYIINNTFNSLNGIIKILQES